MTVNQEQISTANIKDAAGVQQIFISGRIWHELYPKVDPAPFLKVMRERIDLGTYGEGIAEWYFTFVVLEEISPNFFSWLGSTYRPKQASIDIGVRLPYQEVVDGDQVTVMNLMENAILEGIDTIHEHDEKLIAPFNYLAFRADVEAIFAEPSWFEAADPIL